MQIKSLLTLSRTRCGAESNSKKRALEIVANVISEDNPDFDPNEIFISLTARERLGSTGLGNGIAIPHCRIKNCSSVNGVLIKLEKPIDYEAIDEQPVDLMFALIVPEEAHEQHLQILAGLAEKFTQKSYLNCLRQAQNDEELFKAAITKLN